jgi:membrane associated rhomboid family serine protease
MGIYDREYYQNEGGPGGFGGGKGVCFWLIVVNVVAFLIQLSTRNQALAPSTFTTSLVLNVDRVIHGEVWRLLTYAFLHDPSSPFHILFNMIFLWMFGRAMEEMYGAKEFLAFYLFSAIVGGLAYVGVESLRGSFNSTCWGASGAVTAVLVLFALHFPNLKVLFMFVIPMRIITLVVIVVGIDALTLLGDGRTGVAVAVHLGGAAFGYLYFKKQWRVLNWWPSRMSMRPRRHVRPRLRVFRDDEDTALSDQADPEQLFEAEVDRVLAKVKQHGKSSLTERENQILLKASEVYKQRRK